MLEQLPLAIEPEPGESPGSYCLRSVGAQGLNMHWLRRAVGLPYSAYPTRDHERSVAHVLRAPQEWVRNALPEKIDATVAGWNYQGQQLRADSYLRFRRPQVCSTCLHARGYCLALWDFSFITICPEHGHQLVDHCLTCGRRLSWDRPAVDVCACGRAIRGATRPVGSEHGRILDRIVEGHLRADPLKTQVFEAAGMPRFLADLSLNGLLCVIHAFGELSQPHERGAPGAMTRMRTTAQWREVMERAGGRLHQFATMPMSNPRLAAVVSEVILKRLHKYPLSFADLQVARLLFRALFGATSAKDGLAQGQMELFA
jgi:hypothetical protein